MLYNNTKNTHTHMRAHAYAHVHSAPNEGIGTAVKKSLEIISKQVRLEDGFKRGGRIRVAECLRQFFSRQIGQHKKPTFHQMFLCLHGG